MILSIVLLCLSTGVGLNAGLAQTVSLLWLLMPALVMGLVLIWRYRWMYWLASGSSLVSLLAALMATEHQLSWAALSILYLFVRV